MQVGNGPGNHTLTVRTINVGLTLLSVSDSGNVGAADYIPIPVEHAIHPQEAHRLVVGDVVCFSVQLTGPDGEWCTFCGVYAEAVRKSQAKISCSVVFRFVTASAVVPLHNLNADLFYLICSLGFVWN